ncbi:MAG: hypothetical protein AABZ12_04065 [Planctomycetota bacterium]
MEGSRKGLVGRIHRQFRRAGIRRGQGCTALKIDASDLAELKARLDRLRAEGDGFAQVGLSSDVASRMLRRERVRVGGVCVPTDG